MPREPFQVLVLLYRHQNDCMEYCVFNRADSKQDLWQFISGGGENNETKKQAAIRELYEETGIVANDSLIELSSASSIPSNCFPEIEENFPDISHVPEYSFAIEVNECIQLSREHKEYIWSNYHTTIELLEYNSNKKALFELSKLLQDKRSKSIN
jgi:dATP pyrophosphohydrolase